MSSLSLQSRSCGSVHVVQCVGRIVVGAEESSLESALTTAARDSVQIVVNLKQVTRLDSAGLGLLVRHATLLGRRGGDLRLAAAPPAIVSLLELTRLNTVLRIFRTEDEAILSFLKQHSADKVGGTHSGARVLMYDHSPDLCMFVRAVLGQRGLEVTSVSNLHDARILLQGGRVDTILLGPGVVQAPAPNAAGTLKSLAPKATLRQLDPAFDARDAEAASKTLLGLFGLRS